MFSGFVSKLMMRQPVLTDILLWRLEYEGLTCYRHLRTLGLLITQSWLCSFHLGVRRRRRRCRNTGACAAGSRSSAATLTEALDADAAGAAQNSRSEVSTGWCLHTSCRIIRCFERHTYAKTRLFTGYQLAGNVYKILQLLSMAVWLLAPK